MPGRPIVELHRHHLHHISHLRVDPVVFRATFEHACSMHNCDASCCRYGVMLDVEERDKILRHGELIGQHMDGDQVRDTGKWFERAEEEDDDFPSGRAVGTEVVNGKCVFLRNDSRCVLQVAASADGMKGQGLKPFYCFAYPITIESGVLTIDDPDFTNRQACCSMIPGGSKDVVDVCRGELEFVLGVDGVTELLTSRSAGERSHGGSV